MTIVREVQERGVKIVLNAKVIGIDYERDKSGRVRLTLASGEEFLGDLVVGADGIRSRCREALLSRSDPPLPTGDLAYRIILTADQLKDDEDLQKWVENPQVHFWVGPYSHVVGYSVRNGQMFNLVLLCPDNLPEHVDRQTGEVQEMRALSAD